MVEFMHAEHLDVAQVRLLRFLSLALGNGMGSVLLVFTLLDGLSAEAVSDVGHDDQEEKET